VPTRSSASARRQCRQCRGSHAADYAKYADGREGGTRPGQRMSGRRCGSPRWSSVKSSSSTLRKPTVVVFTEADLRPQKRYEEAAAIVRELYASRPVKTRAIRASWRTYTRRKCPRSHPTSKGMVTEVVTTSARLRNGLRAVGGGDLRSLAGARSARRGAFQNRWSFDASQAHELWDDRAALPPVIGGADSSQPCGQSGGTAVKSSLSGGSTGAL
jgi:hypothetical protein